MKMWTVAAALLFVCTYGAAQTAQTARAIRKPCEDLKAEIAGKLDAKKAIGYTLEIVDKGKESPDGKIIGSCDGGTKSIVYQRGGATPAKADSSDNKKPQ